jgi:hypothetical protein
VVHTDPKTARIDQVKDDSDMSEKTRKRIGRLKSPSDVAKYIARCIRMTEKGEGDVNTSYKLVMMASMMLKAFETSEFDDRLTRLENTMREKKQ